jgi:predicted ATPase
LFKKGNSSSSLIAKEGYGSLLPDDSTVDALSAILRLSHILMASRVNASTITISYEEGVLTVQGNHLYLAKEQLKNIILPKNLSVVFD